MLRVRKCIMLFLKERTNKTSCNILISTILLKNKHCIQETYTTALEQFHIIRKPFKQVLNKYFSCYFVFKIFLQSNSCWSHPTPTIQWVWATQRRPHSAMWQKMFPCLTQEKVCTFYAYAVSSRTKEVQHHIILAFSLLCHGSPLKCMKCLFFLP